MQETLKAAAVEILKLWVRAVESFACGLHPSALCPPVHLNSGPCLGSHLHDLAGSAGPGWFCPCLFCLISQHDPRPNPLQGTCLATCSQWPCCHWSCSAHLAQAPQQDLMLGSVPPWSPQVLAFQHRGAAHFPCTWAVPSDTYSQAINSVLSGKLAGWLCYIFSASCVTTAFP